MNGYMLLYLGYMYQFCALGYIVVCLVTFLYAWLHVSFFLVTSIVHLGLITCVYACIWLVTHLLCMLMFACGQVYNDLVVFVMLEVMV